ncbi:hypothetical protein BDZ94DRAFT_1235465 [Collybia nuda]|uniref:Uncharacterized protein n=1 Tax=Collybia nuda TaxID=64659 RepID=A0A9P6CJE3_9AGAR|nr:hypothetical protein BDZ94DRAFT_1235465 [Collybia nuda]
MATTTISHKYNPTETPYVHGSVPLTDNQVISAQVYGFGSAIIVVLFMIYICIYWTFFKPRKDREKAEAIARGDVEEQKPKRPYVLSARWRAAPVDLTAPPPAKLSWWKRAAEPVHNGSFR